jgi:hypothetical protein
MATAIRQRCGVCALRVAVFIPDPVSIATAGK